jgi:glycosyltransferase involved in cell wall biosynthesis
VSTRSLRVALDARIYGARGIGRYTEALHAGLLADESGVSVTAFGKNIDGRSGTWEQLRLPGYIPGEQLEMSRRFAGSGFDVVHLTANTAPVVRYNWPATVVTVHDVLYLKGPGALRLSRSLRQNLGRIYRFVSFLTGTLWVDHIICDSRTTARDLDRLFGTRLPPISVVPCAVSPAFGEPIEQGALEIALSRYGLRHRGYFLHPGAVDPRKNTETVLDAFRTYRARGGHLELAIIGLERPQGAFGGLSPTTGVHILPFIPNADVVALIKGALAVVYVPSAEGFGYPLVEAMAAGTLAVMSSIDVLRETSQGIALEAPPGNAEALADRLRTAATWSVDLRDRVNRGLQRAHDFSIDRMASATVAVYTEAATRRQARRS